MIQHHAQALTMVDLTAGRTLDPEVQQLAEDIRAAQTPEIEEMTDWLTSWGEDIPETVRDHANAHGDMGSMDGDDMGHDMPGMMSRGRPGGARERLRRGVPGHVARDDGRAPHRRRRDGPTEQEDGQYAPAIDLAEPIIDSQTKEIETMNGLLS